MTRSGSSPFDMSDRVVAIVGAGPDIGLATGRVLSEQGAKIACIDIAPEIAAATAATLTESGATASVHVADALDREQVRACFADIIAQHGHLTDVLNIIGRSEAGLAVDVSDEHWDAQMDLNLRTHFVIAQEAARVLEPNTGSFVAISSINGLNTSPDRIAYGVAKAGLISLIRTFALECAPKGLRFNVIAPGPVHTKLAESRGFTSSPAVLARIPLGRMARPEDIGHAALFLMSGLGRMITGQVIVVDGGTTLMFPLKVD